MIYQFDAFQLDTDRHELTHSGRSVDMEPQVFRLIQSFVESDGALLTKDDLIAQVWNGVIVSNAAISARINAARTALGDNGRAQRIIKTVPRAGFRLNVPVEQLGQAMQVQQSIASPPHQDIRFTRSDDGASIAYAVSGQGPPILRAGHWLTHLELDWDSPVWRPQLALSNAGRQLVRYDQRGTGLSDRECGLLHLNDFVADLKAVADAAGLDRFAIHASSQSVPVALQFAAENPERVSRMVIVGGYALGRFFREQQPGELDEDTALALIRNGWGVADSTFVKAFTTLFMPNADEDQVESMVRIQRLSISAEGAVEMRKAVDRFDVRPILRDVQAEVLVLHARGDVIHPIEQGRLLAREIPNARFKMLDTASHIMLPSDPAWPSFTAEIESFLRD